MAELKNWATPSFYEKVVKKIQLPFTQTVSAPVLTAEQKYEKRKELSRRLGIFLDIFLDTYSNTNIALSFKLK